LIKEKLNIEDVIGEYLDLKSSGQNFKALCPFHQEKTPSFVVSPDKKIWKCFGCGEGGDIFSFVMKQENLEFKDALRHLAQKAGVSLSLIKQPEDRQKERLLKIQELADKYFRAALKISPAAQDARAYLYLERGIQLRYAVSYCGICRSLSFFSVFHLLLVMRALLCL